MTPDPAITHVVLLAPTTGASALRLQVDAGGRILARAPLVRATADDPGTTPAARTVVVVPGTAAPAQWLDLPAGPPQQARAAARVLLRDRLAGDLDATHVAVGHAAAGAPVPVVTVAHADMDAWLQRIAALGLRADALVPDHLALPEPAAEAAGTDTTAGDATGHAVALGDDWLVRTGTQAFRAEASLARHLHPIAPDATLDIEVVQDLLARGACHAPIDLLQDRYAPVRDRARGARTWHRAVGLAATLALSVPLLWLAACTRQAVETRTLEARTAARVAAALPDTPDGQSPAQTAREAWQRVEARHGFARAAQALFAGVHALDGTAAVERLDWRAGDGLRASVLHDDVDQLDTLAQEAGRSGLHLVVAGSRNADGRTLSEIQLQAAAP